MKILKAKGLFKGDIDGGLTLEQYIEIVNTDSLTNGISAKNDFQKSFTYDITRTVCNILSNATIKYTGISTPFCISLQKNLIDIFFEIYNSGFCWVTLGESGAIISIGNQKKTGAVQIIDNAYRLSKITQKMAVEKSMELYGVITDCMFSVLDERGMLGIFSPQKDTVIKASQTDKIYETFRTLFGAKTGKRKFGVVEVPMVYSGVNIPVKDMELIANKKDATATIARLFGIQEDMILSGSTFDNKENAIIQTYTDYKGLIYDYINQIESNLISLTRNVENYEVTFPV